MKHLAIRLNRQFSINFILILLFITSNPEIIGAQNHNSSSMGSNEIYESMKAVGFGKPVKKSDFNTVCWNCVKESNPSQFIKDGCISKCHGLG